MSQDNDDIPYEKLRRNIIESSAQESVRKEEATDRKALHTEFLGNTIGRGAKILGIYKT